MSFVPEKVSHLNSLYQPLKEKQSDTIIPFTWINKHSSQYQCLLQRIADYLLEGGIWWEELDIGIKFNDKSEISTNLRLHHFRSTNLKADKIYLNKCWLKCLENKNILIPAIRIKLQVNDSTEKILLRTLTRISIDEKKEHYSFESEKSENIPENIESTPEDIISSSEDNTDNSSRNVTFNLENISDISDITQSNSDSFNLNVSNVSPPEENSKPTTPSNTTPPLVPQLLNELNIENKTSRKSLQLTSTPFTTKTKTKAKEIISFQENNVNKEISKPEVGFSKSATLLNRIFENEKSIIQEYDKLRKKIKAKTFTKANITEYQHIE